MSNNPYYQQNLDNQNSVPLNSKPDIENQQQNAAYNNQHGYPNQESITNEQVNPDIQVYPQADIDKNETSDDEQFNSGVDRMMRLGFIRKVYGVLTFQLILTVAIASLGLNDSVKDFYINNLWLFYVAIASSIIIIIPLTCYPEVARKVPGNYILLTLFTICESIMVSYIVSTYPPETVMIAAGLTIVIVVGLTVYACNTKTDFTWLGGILVCSLLLMFCLGLFSIIFGGFLRTLYCVLGVFVFSLYLIFDTQLIMGKFGTVFQIDDYIFAALNIYLDIIQIFIYLLSIIGGRR
jgi:FtsH-binding integral membrane protein